MDEKRALDRSSHGVDLDPRSFSSGKLEGWNEVAVAGYNNDGIHALPEYKARDIKADPEVDALLCDLGSEVNRGHGLARLGEGFRSLRVSRVALEGELPHPECEVTGKLKLHVDGFPFHAKRGAGPGPGLAGSHVQDLPAKRRSVVEEYPQQVVAP